MIKETAKPALLFLVLSIFLLSACPVKKSINLFLFNNAGVENTGLNYNKAGTLNGNYLSGFQVCSIADQLVLSGYHLKSSKFAFPSFPTGPDSFFPLPANSLEAGLAKGLRHYTSEAMFAKALIPIYIINRRLLI